MTTSKADWANMSAEERKALKDEQIAGAIEAVKAGNFPTGLVVVVGGKELLEAAKRIPSCKAAIARPARQTGSGGVTYSLGAQQGSMGHYNTRFNKFSYTLMGEGSINVADAFDREELPD